MNTKMLIFKTTLLALTIITCPAAFTAGGESGVGGGTAKGNSFVDTVAIENSLVLKNDEAFKQITNPTIETLAKYLPDMAERLQNYLKNKYFVGLEGEELPAELKQIKEGDVRHEVGDKLVAVQRGPIIWYLRDSFYLKQSTVSQGNFQLHEMAVADKLASGESITKGKKDQIVSLTILLSQLRNNPNNFTAKELQEKITALGFDPGRTADEVELFTNEKNRILNALQLNCNIRETATFWDDLIRGATSNSFFQIKRLYEQVENLNSNLNSNYSNRTRQDFSKFLDSISSPKEGKDSLHYFHVNERNVDSICQNIKINYSTIHKAMLTEKPEPKQGEEAEPVQKPE